MILCVLFWSGNFVVGRYIRGDIEPIELAFFRWIFVFIIILPVLIKNFKTISNSVKNNFKILLLLSFLGITLFNTILYTGLSATTSTNALIINSCIPIVIIVLSYFILKQNITLIQGIGIIFSTLGVIYLVLKGDIGVIYTLEFNEGDFWIIISSLTWALYSVIVKFKPKDLNDLEFFATIVTIGLILLTPIYLVQGYEFQEQIKIVKNNFFIFIYVSVFASVLSYYFWHYGIKEIGANKTSQFTHLMPLFGSFLAYIFLGETLELYHIIGMFLIATGIYLSIFYKKRQNENR